MKERQGEQSSWLTRSTYSRRVLHLVVGSIPTEDARQMLSRPPKFDSFGNWYQWELPTRTIRHPD